MNDLAVATPEAQAPRGAIEISVRGKWVKVPALGINGQTIAVRGKWIKIASLYNEDWLEAELADPVACFQKLKELPDAPRADIFCFSQKVPATNPRYAYPAEMRSIAVANVANFKNWWEKLPQETRKNVRRSQKRGVVIKVKGFDADVIKGIADVQNETPIRQGRPYIHYGKSLDEVKHDHGDFIDRSDFICAYFENELIGFLKLVYRGDVASLLQLNSKAAHYDKRPSNALLTKAVELCEARNISYLTYGLFNYGNKGDTPLREFKVRNGFGEMLVPTYYVPLTAWGKLCVKTRLYRGPMGILPRTLITTAVNMRSKWYSNFTQKPV
ncbi:MAG: hypothetical protein WAM85_05455 [Terracidiphilus sp.]